MEIISIRGIQYKKSPNAIFLIKKNEEKDINKQGDIYVKKENFDSLDEKTKYLFNTYMERNDVKVEESSRVTRQQKHVISLNDYYHFKIIPKDSMEFKYDLTLRKDHESTSRNDCLIFAEKLGILMYNPTNRKENELIYDSYNPEKEDEKKGFSKSVFKNNSTVKNNKNKLGASNIGNFISLVREFDKTFYIETIKPGIHNLIINNLVYEINPEIGNSYILMKYLYNNIDDPDYKLWRKVKYEIDKNTEELIAKIDDEFILYPIDIKILEGNENKENYSSLLIDIQKEKKYYEFDLKLPKSKKSNKIEQEYGNCIIIDDFYCLIPMYNEYKLDIKYQGACPYHAACVVAKDEKVNITLEADLGDKTRIFPVFDMYEVSHEEIKKPNTFYGTWSKMYSYKYPEDEKLELDIPKLITTNDKLLIQHQKEIVKNVNQVLPILLHAVVDLKISKDDKDISTTPRSRCKICTRSRKNVKNYIKRKSGVKSLPIPNNIKLFKKSLRKTQSERKKSKSKTQKLNNN